MLLLTGVSGQFSFELFGDASYGSIIFYMVVSLWLITKYIKNNKKKYIILFGLLLSFLVMCSIRFPIYIGAPLICSILFLIYKNGFKKQYIVSFIVIILSILLGYVMHQKLGNTLFLINTYDTKQILESSSELMYNTYDTAYNYLWINGCTHKSVYSLTFYINNDFISVTSPTIVITFIKVLFTIVITIIPFMLIKNIKKFKDNEQVLIIFTSSLIVILLFFFIFGKMSSWFRYITPIVFFQILLIPFFYNLFFDKQKKSRMLFNFAIIIISLASFLLMFNSYFDIKEKHFRTNPNEGLTKFLIEKDLSFGYMQTGWEHNVYNTLSNGKVRITRLVSSLDAPHYWLNSTDWFDDKYTNDKIFFIRGKEDTIFKNEDKSIEHYEYENYEIFVFDNISIFTNEFMNNN